MRAKLIKSFTIGEVFEDIEQDSGFIVESDSDVNEFEKGMDVEVLKVLPNDCYIIYSEDCNEAVRVHKSFISIEDTNLETVSIKGVAREFKTVLVTGITEGSQIIHHSAGSEVDAVYLLAKMQHELHTTIFEGDK